MNNKISFLLNIPGEFLLNKRPDVFIEVEAEKCDNGLITTNAHVPTEVSDNMRASVLIQVLEIAGRRAEKLFDDVAPGAMKVTADGKLIDEPVKA